MISHLLHTVFGGAAGWFIATGVCHSFFGNEKPTAVRAATAFLVSTTIIIGTLYPY